MSYVFAPFSTGNLRGVVVESPYFAGNPDAEGGGEGGVGLSPGFFRDFGV